MAASPVGDIASHHTDYANPNRVSTGRDPSCTNAAPLITGATYCTCALDRADESAENMDRRTPARLFLPLRVFRGHEGLQTALP